MTEKKLIDNGNPESFVIRAPPEVQVASVACKAEGVGFDRIQHIAGSTYKDNSTVVIVPVRGVLAHTLDDFCRQDDHRRCRKHWMDPKISQAIDGMINPMNGKRATMYCTGHEVGQAYNAMIQNILNHPDLSKWKYVMTVEDDNLVPPDAHIRLLESIEWGKYDAVSGIYFTKGDYNMPMAYGDPGEFARTGILEFRPRDVRDALTKGNIMEVNGIAMGCALWRMDLFREIPPPWYVTCADVIPDKGARCFTQDLYFCERAKRAGKRFAVDFRVRVGHMDVASGVVY